MRILIIFFLLLISNCVYSVPVIFKTNQSVLVRTPAGVVAKPGIGQLLSSVPSASSSATVNGNFPLSIGKASLPIPVSTTYSAGAIAAVAADAILSKSAVGAISILALPYVLDALTDQYVKNIKQPDTSPTLYAQRLAGDNSYCTPAGCWGNSFKSVYTNPHWLNLRTVYRATVSSTMGGIPGIYARYEAFYKYDGNPPEIQASYDAYVRTGTCPSGSSFETTTGNCKLDTPGCTPPSIYDPVNQICLGSSINEPANAAQLKTDIEDSLHNNPASSPLIVDDLLQHDIEPSAGIQEISNPTNPTVPGSTETTTRNYNDPSTSHPMTEQTTKSTSLEVSKTGPNQLDVTPTTVTTTTITDNITNVTNISTETSSLNPSESTTETETKTDCDKYPESIGCSKYGEIPATESLPNQSIPIQLNPISLGDSAICPTPQQMALSFGNIQMTYQPLCDLATKIRPFIIAISFLIAGFMVVNTVRNN